MSDSRIPVWREMARHPFELNAVNLASALNAAVTALEAAESGVGPGDVMRMSVELIEQIRNEPEQRSLLVRVLRIQRLEDGSKLLWLERAEAGRVAG